LLLKPLPLLVLLVPPLLGRPPPKLLPKLPPLLKPLKPPKLPKPVLWARKLLEPGLLGQVSWLKRLRQLKLLRLSVGRVLVRLRLNQQCNQRCRLLVLRRGASPQCPNLLALRR
jgi:hypothetical protein